MDEQIQHELELWEWNFTLELRGINISPVVNNSMNSLILKKRGLPVILTRLMRLWLKLNNAAMLGLDHGTASKMTWSTYNKRVQKSCHKDKTRSTKNRKQGVERAHKAAARCLRVRGEVQDCNPIHTITELCGSCFILGFSLFLLLKLTIIIALIYVTDLVQKKKKFDFSVIPVSSKLVLLYRNYC